MTQIEEAKKGNITPEMEDVARIEGVDIKKIVSGVANGRIVIPKNINRSINPCGVGEGLTTKINANIGSSSEMDDINYELEKALTAVKYGAHAIMDLSTGDNLNETRKAIIKAIDVPIGTVPIYEVGVSALKKNKPVIDMTEDDMFRVIESQAKEGVDFMTVHCGITKNTVDKLIKSDRIMGVVSRGGAFLSAWIKHNEEENPFYKNYEYLLELAYEYDVTLSLGDGLRPGCLSDATDIPQIQELITLGELVKKARAADVQCMVEGPGHVPLDQIAANMKIQKTICDHAPFYVLGPIVTDLAPGYDHITSAIGGTIAAFSGANFLCYVTPAEHLAIPELEDVKEGVIASRIAAQAADVANGINSAWAKEKEMSIARRKFDWEKQFDLAFDSEKPRARREVCEMDDDMCSMCGEYCALRITKDDF